MTNIVYQVARPFATLFFYKNYIRKECIKELRTENPRLTQEQAEAHIDHLILQNKIPALDPAGSFRPGVDRIKEDPSSVSEVLEGWLWKGVKLLLIYAILAYVFVRIVGGPM